jgi:class 3 adenylate cyclase
LSRAIRATLETLVARNLSPTLAGTERHPVVDVDVPAGLLAAADTALEVAEGLDEVRDGHGLLGFALGVGAAPTPRFGYEGDAVHLAARLREAAPVAEILLGGSAWPELSDQLVIRRAPELAPIVAGGPIPVFLLEGSLAVPDDAPDRRRAQLKSV